jgi:hypothetical protein
MDDISASWEVTEADMNDPALLAELASLTKQAAASSSNEPSNLDTEELNDHMRKSPSALDQTASAIEKQRPSMTQSDSQPRPQVSLTAAATELLSEYQTLLQATNQKALECKRKKDLEQARALLIESKALTQDINNIFKGIDPNVIRQTTKDRQAANKREFDYVKVNNAMSGYYKSIVAECNDVATEMKTRVSENDKVSFLKLKERYTVLMEERKNVEIILGKIKSLYSHPSKPEAPEWHYNVSTKSVSILDESVPIDSVELCLHELSGLVDKSNKPITSGEISVSIAFPLPVDVPFLATSPTVKLQKENSSSVQLNHVFKSSTHQNNRSSIRAIERRPLLLQVTHTVPKLLGLSSTSSVIGRGAVSLSELLSKSSLSVTVPLHDPSLIPEPTPDAVAVSGGVVVPSNLLAGKKLVAQSAGNSQHALTGGIGNKGSLSLSVKLHAPLKETEVQFVETKIPTITSFPSVPGITSTSAVALEATKSFVQDAASTVSAMQKKNAAAVSAPAQKRNPPPPPSASSRPSPSTEQQPQQQKPQQQPTGDQKQSSGPVSSPPPGPSEDVLDLELDPTGWATALDLKSYVSFEAINAEISRCGGGSVAAPAMPPPSFNSDELNKSRVEMLTVTRDMLTLEVDLGRLTMPDYAKKMQAAFQSDLQLIKALNAAGLKDAAAFVLARAKITKQDIQYCLENA